ncbi:MAG: tetratricopeptide repeat protein [Pyrinomonadaceae bacterium]
MKQRLITLAPFVAALAVSALAWRLTERFRPHCIGSVEYSNREDAGTEAYLRHDYAEALKQFEANLNDSKKCGDNLGAYYSYWNLEHVYVAQQRDDEAEETARQEIAYAEKIHSPDDPFVLSSLSDLTLALLKENRLNEAEAVNDRALKIIKRGSVGEWKAAAELNASLSEIIRQRKAGGAGAR